MTSANHASQDVQSTIDREVDVLESAIRLVASGATTRTVVAGLRLSEAVMPLVTPIAQRHGVTLEPIYRTDEEGWDIVVRRPAVEPD